MARNDIGASARLRWTIIFAWKLLAVATIIGFAVYSNASTDTDIETTENGCAEGSCRVRRSADDSAVAEDETGGQLYPPEVFDMSQKRHGAFLLYVFAMFYMFCALAIVCDEFFVPALEVIIDKWGISEDVAGATLMAAGGSAPELFTSIIGVFISQSDVGIGTIVGSAVFNVLFVIGMCAMFSKGILELTWWPLFRDCSFYIVSIIMLMIFFVDGQIMWWEAMLLLMYYVGYVVFMKYNQRIEVWFKDLVGKGCSKVKPDESNESNMNRQTPESEKEKKSQWTTMRKLKIMHQAKAVTRRSTLSRDTRLFNAVIQVQVPSKVDEEKTVDGSIASTSASNALSEDDDGFFDMSWPQDDIKKQSLYVFFLGITGPLWLTLPDVRREGKDKWYPGCFIGSILWIGAFSYIMVWMAEVIGTLINVPPQIMGLTFLAAGTSVPDLITSVIVAKKGFGDMAVSSSIGSNIFDITIGLPFPWLLNSLIKGFAPNAVTSDGLFCSIGLLLIMLVFVFVSIAWCKWKMSKLLGLTMFILYGVFVAMSLMLTDGVIKCPFNV